MAISEQDIKFADFSLVFTPHPNTGDITRLINDESIKRSVKNLVLTGYNERLFAPAKGCGVYHLLFELISPPVANGIEEQITATLRNYEPRIIVTNVLVYPDYDNNGYNVTIRYEIINRMTIQTIDFFLEMIR
jgi:phage baseplate assembly protein W